MSQSFLRCLLPFLLVTVATPVEAQEFCFREAGGTYEEPPAWWAGGSPLGSATTRWIDDPRWEGASGVGHLNDGVRFRGLVETSGSDRFLVLMWHVKAAPRVQDDELGVPLRRDRLYFGFVDDVTGRGNIFRIDPAPIGATPAPNGLGYFESGYGGSFYHRTGGGWSPNNTGNLFPPPLPNLAEERRARRRVLRIGGV